MNSKQLRRSLKIKWLTYYRDNREWIDKLGIWVTSNGHRRPSSGFILGALATLEPDLTNLLPLVVDLSSNPDRIISALGLDTSPVKELAALEKAHKMLPSSPQSEVSLASAEAVTPLTIDAPPPLSPAYDDEACSGAGGREVDRPRT
ncbi:DUF5331 domain-containing protein [Nodosilinea sp. E11]|uniref:DUF5331 domain-containing protein n=1 Tax=Nodosilinea sp. E11 TaxID=3037479 RepID=UPI0029347DC7|nr:DUF5331 domain-containing protein [Nodosilinea sp. E11]WOD41583.1 DUF5331 domain-containing protein [Nodosilinea sp. E11]